MPITEDQIIQRQTFDRRIGTPDPRPADITFGQAVGDAINYYLQPIAQNAAVSLQHTELDPNFDWTQGIPDRHAPYTVAYADALNAEHQAEITRYIDERQALRERQSRTPLGYQIAAEIFNPVNYLGIAFGSPILTGGRIAAGRTILRGSASAAAVEAGINLNLQRLDPVQSYVETLMNTASVAVFSGAFEGASVLRASSRQAAMGATRQQAEFMGRVAQRIDQIQGVDETAISRLLPRDQRQFGDVDDVQSTADSYSAQIADLERELSIVGADSGQARFIQDSIDELTAQRQPYADEVLFRAMEEEGLDVNDMFRYSAGGNTWLSSWVTTPYRRVMNADYGSANNFVKSIMYDMSSDGGVQLEFHRGGIARGLSVFQEAVRDMGEYIRVNDSLARLWAEDTGAPEIGSSILSNVDINATNLARRAQGQPNSQDAWLVDVNRRRLMGEEMTPNQQRAADLMTEYYENFEKRLIETGQLRTRQTVGRQISRLEQEITALEGQIESATGARLDELRGTLARRESLISELRIELDAPVADRVEPHLPRYFNIGVIRRRRTEFADILTRWFTENPYIMSYNEGLKKWERVELATDPDSIARRVDQTIDNILNEEPNPDVDQVFTGSGRAGHLGFRKLDIPNSLVWDFIEQNPIATMRNYTARVSPQYHFQKKFGTSRAGVVENIRTRMREAGVREDKIQSAVRDFNHMYDRVVGSVIRDPNSWDQKAASVLRDATSFTYLGGAGIAALGDAGRIVMEAELGALAKASQAFFDPAIRRLTIREGRLSAAGIELNLGSAGLRIADDQNFNFLNNAKMDRVRNAFHTLNLLGPVTVTMKNFTATMGAHMLIEYSQRLARGAASDFEVRYLARHGIDQDLAQRISNAPWQTDKNSGLFLANTDAWEGNYAIPKVDDERVNVIEVNEDGTSVGRTNAQGEYVAAYYRRNEGGDGGTIYFDREYIEGEMYDRKPWRNPRVEGVNALPDDAFPTPRAWANFVMLHEIMHTRFSADDLGFVKRQSGEITIDNSPAGMSRGDIIDGLESGTENMDLVFHVTNDAESIIENGFNVGGTVRGSAILDSGYGEYVTVFDVRGIVDRIKSDQKLLDELGITPDEVDGFLAKRMYGQSSFLSVRSSDGQTLRGVDLLYGEKPVAVIHISELPKFGARRFEGDRADELGDQQGLYTAESNMLRDYRSGVLNKETFDDYPTPPSYWGLSYDELAEELDKDIALEDRMADIARRYNPFEERVTRPSTVINKAAYENRINELAMEEHRQSLQVAQETVQRFRGALGTHVNNTVMAANPSDKPIIMDGVIYIRQELGERFGLKPDPQTPGYSRVENGLLALPLQFYSFTLANVNKTVGLMMQGAVRNRTIGIAAMIGMGWMISSIRTPDYVWQDMNPQDKLGRAIDMSGVAALYSDLFYTTLQTSLALGGPNLTGGIIQPRYPQEPNVGDAITNVTGAASGWTLDMARSAATFARGEYGEGASQFIRNLPFSNLWFLKDDVNQIGRYLSN